MITLKDKFTKKSLVDFLKWFKAFCIKQWFFIVLAIFIGIAKAAPNFARQQGLIRAEYSIGYGAVAVIFLQSGLSMKTRHLLKNMGNWRAHLTVMVISFLVSSSIMYGLCSAIKHTHDRNIDEWVLVGLIVTATCPTTVSSNVVMTTQANGNALLCLCEVFIGNMLGAFISPALLQMYTSNPTWAFANPANGSSVQELYASVMKQLGLSVFIPTFVGQVVQNLFPKQTKWFLTTFYLNKVSSFCLLLIMFSSFSTAFYQRAFESIPKASCVFLVFFNIGIYLFWTVICYFFARPFFIPMIFKKAPTQDSSRLYRWSYKVFKPFYYNRTDTICVMFCGAAKTAALGVSLITSQYGPDFQYLGKLLASLVLYQALQVITAQVLVNFFKKWEEKDHLNEGDEESQKESSTSQNLEMEHYEEDSPNPRDKK
jgi:sodium/bile acid cotransporter 7